MNRLLTAALLLSGVATPALAEGAANHARTAGGVVVHPARGEFGEVRVSLHGDGIFHVVATPRSLPQGEAQASLMAPAPPPAAAFTVRERAGHLLIEAARASADIDLADGRVRFLDPAGKELLAESGGAVVRPASADGEAYVSVSQQFNRGTDEGLYGLGQHQQAVMNHNGQDVELAQHNMDIAVPFLVSTRNYGLLWDNNGISRFGNPQPYALVGSEPGLAVTAAGKPGFRADYFLDGRLAVSRQEETIAYQYLKDQKRWPEAARSSTVAATGGQNTAGNAVQKQTVIWSADLTAQATGIHRFQVYGSSYYKVFVDGKPVLDRWRQNWNPWYAGFDVPLTAGKPAAVRIEWEPNQGYMALLHSDPLPAPDRHSVWFTSDVARAKSYWFIAADSADGVIAGYRQLTGKAEMLPKWAYGFWQSRQRYKTEDELLGVVSQYRAQGIPLDNIVLDWFYWKEDQWGSHRFDPARFADPGGMIAKVHEAHANFMISVWPKFYQGTDTFTEFDGKGLLYKGNIRQGNRDWVGPGYLSTFYDAYSPEARALFWKRVEERLGKLDVDAWWADASEPDMHSNLSIPERIDTMGPTAIGPAATVFNAYPLMNARSFHEGWSSFKPGVRPFLLTRSGFGGLQRYGAAIWSGDVASRWYDLRAQISAGVNAAMSGLPNWTHDIGGFALEDRFSAANPRPEDLAEWRELNLRWFQFGAFSPLFRSHGEFPYREIYEISPAGSEMRQSMIWHDRLRYRLMPYIYTLAADSWMKDGSIMRGLAMDFPQDRRARDIDDQYLFGQSLMVAPVTEYRARSRSVWLPGAGTWYDFATGKPWRGGTQATVAAPLARMPLFVRAGAIVPVGPVTQYVDEKPDAPITLAVYTGADGAFSLYEDDGRSTAYKDGAWSRIPIHYDERTGRVTIGARQGKGWAGMPASRLLRVVWLGAGKPLGDDPKPDAEVRYDGRPLVIPRPVRR